MAYKLKTSRTSSIPAFLIIFDEIYDNEPATTAIKTAAWGDTNPEPGVIPAKPLKKPFITTEIEKFSCWT